MSSVSRNLLVIGPLLVLGLAGCKSEKTAGTASPANQPKQPSAAAQPSEQPTSSKTSSAFLDNYPEYEKLRHPNYDEEISYLPEYKQAVLDHDAKIKSVVGKVFDPQLQERLLSKARIPEVNKDDFLELAKDKVKERRSAFLASHPNCYFTLGTYEFYFPNRKTALFNVVKYNGRDETAKAFGSSNGFGGSIPYKKDKYGSFVIKGGRDSNAFNVLLEYDAEFIDYPNRISSRYKGDWMSDDEAVDYGLLIPITMEQMDSIYAVVRNKFGAHMEEIWSSEMKIGGDTTFVGGVSGWVPYDCERIPAQCTLLRKAIESFVRRQSIWILAQGDPMEPSNIRVDHAWVVVGGPDIYLTLK